jgi:hypothetical protein
MRRIPPRTLERQTCELECAIEATATTPERRAVLRNLSLTGARLEGPELDDCPDEFELRIVHVTGAVETLNVQCVWRQRGVVGVRFLQAQPAERRRLFRYSRAS